MADFAAIEAEVTALESVVDSAVAAFDGVAQMVAEAVAANDAGDNSQLSTLAGRIQAKKQALADAIVANTPAAEEPPA